MSPRGLVVDDESDIRLSIGLALRIAGYEVLEAATGLQAVRGVVEQRPDAVLLDLRLGDIDGWTVPDRLRDLGRFSRRCRWVVGSADAAPAARDRGLAAGCVGYLVKPFEPVELLALLATRREPTSPDHEGRSDPVRTGPDHGRSTGTRRPATDVRSGLPTTRRRFRT